MSSLQHRGILNAVSVIIFIKVCAAKSIYDRPVCGDHGSYGELNYDAHNPTKPCITEPFDQKRAQQSKCPAGRTESRLKKEGSSYYKECSAIPFCDASNPLKTVCVTQLANDVKDIKDPSTSRTNFVPYGSGQPLVTEVIAPKTQKSTNFFYKKFQPIHKVSTFVSCDVATKDEPLCMTPCQPKARKTQSCKKWQREQFTGYVLDNEKSCWWVQCGPSQSKQNAMIGYTDYDTVNVNSPSTMDWLGSIQFMAILSGFVIYGLLCTAFGVCVGYLFGIRVKNI